MVAERSVGRLLLLNVRAIGEGWTSAGAADEDERLLMLKELMMLDDDCCYWRGERIISMVVFERETCDRKKGAVGGS